MNKIKYERIAEAAYVIAFVVFCVSMLIGSIILKLGMEALATIFAVIATISFIYVFPVGLFVWIILMTIDEHIKEKETKKHGA